MGMSFGGKPVVCPSRVAVGMRKGDLERLPVDYDAISVCNRYFCPLGDQPAVGRLLMRRKDISEFPNFLTFDSSGNYNVGEWAELKLYDGKTKRTRLIPHLHPIRAKCVTPGWAKDPNSIYRVEVADWRYFARQVHVNKAYNLKNCSTGEWIESTLDDNGSGSGGSSGGGEPTPWTWDRLGEDLWETATAPFNNFGNAYGVGLGHWPGWPATTINGMNSSLTGYPVPQSWTFWQVPALTALQAVAFRLGCSLRWNPFQEQLDIVDLTERDQEFLAAQEALEKGWRRWDEYWEEPSRPRIPAKVRVLFRKLPRAEDHDPYDYVDVPYPDDDINRGSAPGTQVLLYDDLMSTGSNSADLQSRANFRALDYNRLVIFGYRRKLRHYIGMPSDDLFLGSLCGSLAFEDLGGGLHTIIRSLRFPTINWKDYLPICDCECEPTGSGSGSGQRWTIRCNDDGTATATQG